MKNTALHIRINQDLLNLVKKQAKLENRTLSNLVETILKDYINKDANKKD